MTTGAFDAVDEVRTKASTVERTSFRFTQAAIASLVELLESNTFDGLITTIDSSEVEEIARRTRILPFIDPAVARSAWQKVILGFATRSPITGIALGSDIYLAEPLEMKRWSLLVHEFAHVLQYHALGRPRFLAVYTTEYLRNRVRGSSDHEAYYSLSMEVEARALEADAKRLEPPVRPFVVPLGEDDAS